MLVNHNAIFMMHLTKVPRWKASSSCHLSSSQQRIRCATTQYQLRICQHRTCKSQGSTEILKFVEDLRLNEVEGVESGCLGQCGNGPNVLILPTEVLVNHVGTVAQMTELLKVQCGVKIDEKLVMATQLRLRGNAAARQGDFADAEQRYSEALELNLKENRHLLYANRSGVRLEAGNMEGALSDALAAIDHAPLSYTIGHLRLIDVYYLQKNYRKAAEILDDLARRNPEFKSSSEYTAIVQQLRVDLKS